MWFYLHFWSLLLEWPCQYPLSTSRTIRYTWHLDCLPFGGEEWLPRGKNIWQQKTGDNNYWTSRLLVLFCGTFFQCSFFLGWRISKVSNGIEFLFFFIAGSNVDCSEALFTPMMWGTTGVLTTHDPGKLIPILLDHGREGQNGWGWKPMKIYDSKFVNEKTWSVCFKDMLMLKPLVFWRLFFWYQLIWWCVFLGNSSTFWGSLNFEFCFLYFFWIDIDV